MAFIQAALACLIVLAAWCVWSRRRGPSHGWLAIGLILVAAGTAIRVPGLRSVLNATPLGAEPIKHMLLSAFGVCLAVYVHPQLVASRAGRNTCEPCRRASRGDGCLCDPQRTLGRWGGSAQSVMEHGLDGRLLGRIRRDKCRVDDTHPHLSHRPPPSQESVWSSTAGARCRHDVHLEPCSALSLRRLPDRCRSSPGLPPEDQHTHRNPQLWTADCGDPGTHRGEGISHCRQAKVRASAQRMARHTDRGRASHVTHPGSGLLPPDSDGRCHGHSSTVRPLTRLSPRPDPDGRTDEASRRQPSSRAEPDAKTSTMGMVAPRAFPNRSIR